MLLLHANGFSAGTYVEMVQIECLSCHFHVYGIDARGHGESTSHGNHPPVDGVHIGSQAVTHAAQRQPADLSARQHHMPQHGAAAAAADDIGGVAVGGFPLPPSDLVDVVRCLGLERPFVFAHSVHATLALLAEAMAPGLWGAAYLFEPVASVTAAQVDANREAGGMLARRARARRRRWDSPEAACESLRQRPGFAQFTDRSLQAYVASCCAPCADGGVQLRCDVEAAVFEATLPLASGVHTLLGAVRCPVTFARSVPRPEAPDAFIADATAALAAAAPVAQLRTFPGLGHFGPFSHPAAIARDVARQLLHLDRTPPPPLPAKL